jgi:hypothetical protein
MRHPNIGHVTDSVDSIGFPTEVKTVPINIAPGGASATAIVAGVTGKKIRILAMVIGTDTIGTLRFQDDASSPTVLSGDIPVLADSPLVLEFNEGMHWGETAAGDDLDILPSGAMNIDGILVYTEV